MKTKGVRRDDGEKDYEITYNGEVFYVEKHGNKWRCSGGEFSTIKDVKGWIISQSADDQPEPKTIWDHVEPAALLALLMPSLSTDSVEFGLVKQSLDAHGYWDVENDKPDTDRARRTVYNEVF